MGVIYQILHIILDIAHLKGFFSQDQLYILYIHIILFNEENFEKITEFIAFIYIFFYLNSNNFEKIIANLKRLL